MVDVVLGSMHSVNCIMCGRKLTLLKTKVKDGYICGGCIGRLPINVYNDRMNYTGAEMLAIAKDFESRSDTYRNGHYQSKPGSGEKEEAKSAGHSEDMDEFDKMREYKRLLDEGVITEEEYEKKKKELLGI